MSVFLAGAGLFAIAFLIHVFVWNVHRPQHQAVALLLIFLFVGLAGLASVWLLIGTGALPLLRTALAILLYLSSCMFYFLLFSAIASDSPTLTLIGVIRKRGSHGISLERLSEEMTKYSFVYPRLMQMIHDGFLVQVGDRLHPGQRGRILASLVLSYRRLLGKREAGG
jgi:hypothetical protein